VATKLREVKPWGVRLIRIVETLDRRPVNSSMECWWRSSTPDTLKAALRPFVALDKAS
jgi:hypothetical protein